MSTITKRLLAGLIITAMPAFVLAQDAQDDTEDPPEQEGEALEPEEEFAQLLRQISVVEVYNSLLERQIEHQERQLADIQQAGEGVPALSRQVPPLLTRMVDGLEQFVALDLPFHNEERRQRVADLQTMLDDADISVAQKMRRVLEAYQIEIEYGREDEAYTGQLQIGEGTREVSFLKLGRIALYYQTNDDAGTSGIWDPTEQEWIALGSQHRNSLRQALRMANGQVAPELVLVPLFPSVTE